ncbi:MULTISPECIES: helix-turn-helix domain-containing protein [unclassified Bacillus (in: firmicutes)]|uniref:helix-turn-helix domain-containing protein n=1 Tax=unclassified Bacillus (in: firmicutes) TaxID=185979 RepID=UPI0020361AE2|nr:MULTISPECIES: helix-turn-helix domain-containing protein [unclassified Bacillus (in: firmicutes)]
MNILGMKRIEQSAYRWKKAYEKDGLIGLSDARKTDTGRPLKRELSQAEIIERQEARIKLLEGDEPENSLHISKSFSQFERLQKLSNENQLLLTTHWYGSLPVTDTGNVQYIERKEGKRIKINSYDLNNYFEKRGSLPEDIIIKSYFELTSSILSSMRADGTNWIICEGSDDKLYLEYYLKDINNLKIFAVGGCGNVVKLYQYLFAPFGEKGEIKALNSKVLCLIDTDDVLKTINMPCEVRDKVRIARMQYDRKQNIELQRLNPTGLFTPTEMEDCLNPEILYTH